MTIRLTLFSLLLALYATCSAFAPWGDAWCGCVWSVDSTVFEKGLVGP